MNIVIRSQSCRKIQSCFSGTILANIAYGLERVTEKEVMEVIKDVGLEDMIEKLPDGIYTQLGEHGDKLSGGHVREFPSPGH